MSYYIAKGRLDRVNPNYYSVHIEVELAFIDNTIIKVTNIEVSTHRFSVGFVSLDHVDKLPNGAILACSIQLLLYEKICRNNGAFLEKMINLYCAYVFYNKLSIVVVSNLKQVVVTPGTFEISTISISSVLINPQFQKSTDLALNGK
ncbi:hypothetical protein H5410_064310 [Solanum commersonii]|uniref:Uncharacterized protein n=1 Tax=Solanum commersonii TaxID=4109 RepID=A0A9J5VZX4_SOLCO|nr:hypothetical protein H5410_064310 [Solanum commersonii]